MDTSEVQKAVGPTRCEKKKKLFLPQRGKSDANETLSADSV